MKNLSIHTPSALAGAVVLGLVLLAMGVAQSSSVVASVKGPVQIVGQPGARDMVRITLGQPYTVPPGKILVLTGAAVTSAVSSGTLFIDVNGTRLCAAALISGAGLPASFPNGIAIASCDTVQPLMSTPILVSILFGYLESE